MKSSRPTHRLPGFEDLPAFEFSPEGLKRVKGALPERAHESIKDLEVRHYLRGLPDNLRDRQATWVKIEQGARNLAQLIGEARVYPDSIEWIRLFLLDFATDAREQAATYEMLPFLGEHGFTEAGAGKLDKKQLEDEWLYRALSEFWIHHAGEKLSYAHGEGKPGRTTQFFHVVLAEIPGAPKLTDNAVIKIIDRNRKRLGISRQYPAV